MRASVGRKSLALGVAVSLMWMVFTGVAHAQPAMAMSDAASDSGVGVALAAPKEANKIILPETSIAAPAFWTNVPIGEPGAGATAFVAWTGTDPAHHINTMQFSPVSGGFSFTHKDILKETSIAAPAVTAQPSQVHSSYYFVAWTGTDTNHSLNVICDGCASSRIKLTLHDENSFAGPALAMLNGKLMLAWTGTDANHSLNMLDISISDGRFVVGKKTIIKMFSSNAGPGLAYEPNTDVGRGILMTWSDRATRQIRMALSSTGADWARAGQFTLSEWSAATPSLLAIVPLVDVPHSYVAWTGIDGARSINLLYPAYPPQMSATKATLDERALGGPALGYISGSRLALVWTGTDSLHHLNFATIDV